ncbi:MOSC domain-containing protein [Janthinobacterium fluminis]|uniref:MOSC N-terminal beta barrel domain-containing protein n=1 Tax=Janthinobacterium fluminis TaxID=2987524 RepID=A0ABT5K5F4_9BURK|nr:MOSC N-terminal beta barrel domain-containing protein [Janthinobacterium fluminis]MDC8760237.1 MOSC N-terminal beta barrel domain-containing protein [Janthinobacterium fluminis]
MAILTDITLYPIKSCAGIALREATLTRAGLMTEQIYDREWMVVDAAGRFLSQREHPRMALITPRLKANTLELRAPGMLRLEIELGLPDPELAPTLAVQVWDDTLKAYDCDAVTAAWFSNAIGVPCRLVRFHPHARRLASRKWTGAVDAPTLFSDGYPVLLAGAASLDDLNDRLLRAGRAAIPMNRFRPNLVLADLAAFEEDYVESFAFGAMALKPVKPCSRCSIPANDQASGVPGPDPLDILQSYRGKPELDGAICFGMNCIVVDGADERIRVGQEIGVELAF